MFTFRPTKSPTPAPGEYLLARGENRDTITVGCPGCEGEHVLPRHQMVGIGGLVNPDVRCPLYGCGWVQPATLAKWRPR